MNSKVMKRVYSLKLYFQDSPTPLFIDNVWHIQTEGALLRLIINGESQWWPLCNLAFIKEVSMKEVEI